MCALKEPGDTRTLRTVKNKPTTHNVINSFYFEVGVSSHQYTCKHNHITRRKIFIPSYCTKQFLRSHTFRLCILHCNTNCFVSILK